jgi:hypothetical protein
MVKEEPSEPSWAILTLTSPATILTEVPHLDTVKPEAIKHELIKHESVKHESLAVKHEPLALKHEPLALKHEPLAVKHELIKLEPLAVKYESIKQESPAIKQEPIKLEPIKHEINLFDRTFDSHRNTPHKKEEKASGHTPKVILVLTFVHQAGAPSLFSPPPTKSEEKPREA